jgi:kynurenine formamidase
MRLLELTMPLDHEHMADEVFPTATPFIVAPGGHPLKGFSLGTEAGTCLTLPSQFSESRKTARLHEVDLEKLTLRETAVLDVPKDGGEVTAADIDAGWRGAEVRDGDALLIRTGWGDRDYYQRPGARYMVGSPHLTASSAQHLAARMRANGNDLLLTDMAVIAMPQEHLIREWFPIAPRPEPWPSDKASGYLRSYTPEKAAADYGAAIALANSGIMTVKRLVNCAGIQQNRIRIIVGPLKLMRGVGSTCRVVGIEA